MVIDEQDECAGGKCSAETALGYVSQRARARVWAERCGGIKTHCAAGRDAQANE